MLGEAAARRAALGRRRRRPRQPHGTPARRAATATPQPPAAEPSRRPWRATVRGTSAKRTDVRRSGRRWVCRNTTGRRAPAAPAPAPLADDGGPSGGAATPTRCCTRGEHAARRARNSACGRGARGLLACCCGSGDGRRAATARSPRARLATVLHRDRARRRQARRRAAAAARPSRRRTCPHAFGARLNGEGAAKPCCSPRPRRRPQAGAVRRARRVAPGRRSTRRSTPSTPSSSSAGPRWSRRPAARGRRARASGRRRRRAAAVAPPPRREFSDAAPPPPAAADARLAVSARKEAELGDAAAARLAWRPPPRGNAVRVRAARLLAGAQPTEGPRSAARLRVHRRRGAPLELAAGARVAARARPAAPARAEARLAACGTALDASAACAVPAAGQCAPHRLRGHVSTRSHARPRRARRPRRPTAPPRPSAPRRRPRLRVAARRLAPAEPPSPAVPGEATARSRPRPLSVLPGRAADARLARSSPAHRRAERRALSPLLGATCGSSRPWPAARRPDLARAPCRGRSGAGRPPSACAGASSARARALVRRSRDAGRGPRGSWRPRTSRGRGRAPGWRRRAPETARGPPAAPRRRRRPLAVWGSPRAASAAAARAAPPARRGGGSDKYATELPARHHRRRRGLPGGAEPAPEPRERRGAPEPEPARGALQKAGAGMRRSPRHAPPLHAEVALTSRREAAAG